MKPEITATPTLTTERFILRSLTAEDAADIVSITFFEGQPAKSPDDVLQIMNHMEGEQQKGNALHWGIAERDTNIVIGGCGFYRGFLNRTGEVGYIVSEEYRRKGIMNEVLPVVLKFGFEFLFLEKIKAYTNKENIASIALLQKYGFRKVKSDLFKYEKFLLERP